MSSNRIVWFFGPTMLAITCFSAAILCARFISSQREHTRPHHELLQRVNVAMESLRVPSPSILPEEVVRIQLDGLSDPQRSRGVLQCYTFASPGNRIATGPLERFGEMVRREPYDQLIDPDAVLIGTPQYLDGNVRVLVTLVRDRKPASFVWVLSRQTESPYVDCWMTEAVFVLDAEPPMSSEASTSTPANSVSWNA